MPFSSIYFDYRYILCYTESGVVGPEDIYYQGCYEQTTGYFDVSVANMLTVEQCRQNCASMSHGYFSVLQV